MKKKNKTDVRRLTALGLLSAIIAVTAFIPVRTLGLEITLCTVPLALGAALFGTFGGAVCGAVFGLISFIQCFGYSPFGVMMMNVSPVCAFLTCVPTRIAAGYFAGLFAVLIKKRIKKANGSSSLPELFACVSAPVLNTVFFMTVMCLCFYESDFIRGFAQTLHAQNVFSFIILFVGINGLVEIIAGIIIALPVSRALKKAFKTEKTVGADLPPDSEDFEI